MRWPMLPRKSPLPPGKTKEDALKEKPTGEICRDRDFHPDPTFSGDRAQKTDDNAAWDTAVKFYDAVVIGPAIRTVFRSFFPHLRVTVVWQSTMLGHFYKNLQVVSKRVRAASEAVTHPAAATVEGRSEHRSSNAAARVVSEHGSNAEVGAADQPDEEEVDIDQTLMRVGGHLSTHRWTSFRRIYEFVCDGKIKKID